MAGAAGPKVIEDGGLHDVSDGVGPPGETEAGGEEDETQGLAKGLKAGKGVVSASRWFSPSPSEDGGGSSVQIEGAPRPMSPHLPPDGQLRCPGQLAEPGEGGECRQRPAVHPRGDQEQQVQSGLELPGRQQHDAQHAQQQHCLRRPSPPEPEGWP